MPPRKRWTLSGNSAQKRADMPEETIEQESERKLAEADWLLDEDREKLTRMLGKMRDAFASLAAIPAISAEEKTQEREKMREGWLKVLETCRKLEVAEGELLEKQADQANAVREMTMATLRIVHGIKKAMEDGTFTGTWEERESLMEIVEEVEEAKASVVEDITAEDIRQLEDDGVL